MKKSAILIDGEFFSIALRHDLKLKRRPTAAEIYQHALGLADFQTEEVCGEYFTMIPARTAACSGIQSPNKASRIRKAP